MWPIHRGDLFADFCGVSLIELGGPGGNLLNTTPSNTAPKMSNECCMHLDFYPA